MKSKDSLIWKLCELVAWIGSKSLQMTSLVSAQLSLWKMVLPLGLAPNTPPSVFSIHRHRRPVWLVSVCCSLSHLHFSQSKSSSIQISFRTWMKKWNRHGTYYGPIVHIGIWFLSGQNLPQNNTKRENINLRVKRQQNEGLNPIRDLIVCLHSQSEYTYEAMQYHKIIFSRN